MTSCGRFGVDAVAGPAISAIALVAVVAACHGTSALDSSASSNEPPKDAITKTTESGPAKVVLRLWPAKPTLDQQLEPRIEIDAPAGVTVKAPFQEAGDQRLGRFKIVQFTQEPQRTATGGDHQVQRYALEAPSSGKHRVPPLRFEMIDGRGDPKATPKPQEILTDELAIEIAPIKAEAIGAELRAPPGALDPDVGGTPWIVILGIASAIAIAGSGTVLALRAAAARRKLALQRSAYDEAIARLRELETRGAPGDDQADAWFVALSAIVRSYLERRYDIRAPELTTEEFLQVAARASDRALALSADHRALLTTFLERCDRVKFAGYRPGSDESIATLAAARGFIEDTRALDDSPADATGDATPRQEAA